jgi:putative endonuclease
VAIPQGQRASYVYIMTNPHHTVLYTGVTADLVRRVYEHQAKQADGFTKRYGVCKLVYFEIFDDIESAILREKQIKAGSRDKKLALIQRENSNWDDLFEQVCNS